MSNNTLLQSRYRVEIWLFGEEGEQADIGEDEPQAIIEGNDARELRALAKSYPVGEVCTFVIKEYRAGSWYDYEFWQSEGFGAWYVAPKSANYRGWVRECDTCRARHFNIHAGPVLCNPCSDINRGIA